MAWLEGWEKRAIVVIDNTAQGALSGFPRRIRLPAENLTDAQGVRFYLTNNTLLDSELDAYVSQGGYADFHVNCDLPNAGSLTIHAYKNYKGTAPAVTPADVWDASFKAVYHFAQQSGQYQDSSGNAHHATTSTVTSRANIGTFPGYALEFDGDDDFIHVPYHADFDITDTVTLEVYASIVANGSDGQTYNQLLGRYLGYGSGESYGLARQRASTYIYGFVRLSDDSDYEYDASTANAIALNSGWKSFSSVFDCPGTISMYVNGALDGTPAVSTDSIYSGTSHLRMGASGGGAHLWAGYLAEARLSSEARTADWLAATHLSLANTGISVSGWEDAQRLSKFFQIPYMRTITRK